MNQKAGMKGLSLLLVFAMLLALAPLALATNYDEYKGAWIGGEVKDGVFTYQLAIMGTAPDNLTFDLHVYQVGGWTNQKIYTDWSTGVNTFKMKAMDGKHGAMLGEIIFVEDYLVMAVQACSYAPLKHLAGTYIQFNRPHTPKPGGSSGSSDTYVGEGSYFRANAKLSTRTGPGTDYDGKGRTVDYLGYKGEMVKVLTVARDRRNGIWWAQVEVDNGGRLRRAYTGVKRLIGIDVNSLPREGEGWEATLSAGLYPFYGPGRRFEQHTKYLDGGLWGRVITEENGYALFEYWMDGFKHRCWVPKSLID